MNIQFDVKAQNASNISSIDSRVDEAKEGPRRVDAYFSADVETDGPIPGPYSMLSFALVFAGTYDGRTFVKPTTYNQIFYRELRPISDNFQPDALLVNKIDRKRLMTQGVTAKQAMNEAARWIYDLAGNAKPVLVAYPLSFDWSWLYWYFVQFASGGSPFEYSRCFDIKTALAVKAALPISASGRSNLPLSLRSDHMHTHNAVDDAVEQAEIFAKIFEWRGVSDTNSRSS